MDQCCSIHLAIISKSRVCLSTDKLYAVIKTPKTKQKRKPAACLLVYGKSVYFPFGKIVDFQIINHNWFTRNFDHQAIYFASPIVYGFPSLSYLIDVIQYVSLDLNLMPNLGSRTYQQHDWKPWTWGCTGKFIGFTVLVLSIAYFAFINTQKKKRSPQYFVFWFVCTSHHGLVGGFCGRFIHLWHHFFLSSSFYFFLC